jgi:hypothetical protein
MSTEILKIMKEKTPIESSNSSLKFSVPATALAGLSIVILNRLLVTPFSVEEYALVMAGLTVIYNYGIAFWYKKIGV